MSNRLLRNALVLLCLWLVVGECAASAPDGPLPATEDTTFLCRFDGPGLKAEVARGAGDMAGQPNLVDGRFGKAASLAGPEITFPAGGNVDLRRGTIDLWLMNLDLNDQFRRKYRNVLRMDGGAGGEAWYLQVMVSANLVYFRIYMHEDPKTKKGFAYHVFNTEARVLGVGRWTHVRVGWDCDLRTMWAVVNGEHAFRHQFDLVEGVNPMSRLPKGPAPKVVLGEAKDNLLLIDDLRIRSSAKAEDFAAARERRDDATYHESLVSRTWKPSREVESPHAPWARPLAGGPVKVLVVQPWQNLREVVELAQRLEIEYDVIPVTSVESRCDKTKGMFPYEREDFLAKVRGDCQVVILAGIPADWFDQETWDELLAQVGKGKSVVWTISGLEHARVQGLLKDKAAFPEYLQRGPGYTYITLCSEPAHALSVVPVGKGRVVLWNAYGHLFTRYSSMTPIYYVGDCEYYYALMARLVIYAAGRTPAVRAAWGRKTAGADSNKPIQPIGCKVTSPEATEARLDFVVRDGSVGWGPKDATGAEGRKGVRRVGGAPWREAHRETRQETLKPGDNEFRFTVPPLPAGHYSLDLHVSDKAGRVLDWDSCHATVIAWPRLKWLSIERRAYAEGERGAAEALFDRTDGAPRDVRLACEVVDAYGRQVWTQDTPWSGETKQRVEFSTQGVAGKAGWFRVSMKQGDAVLQRAETYFLIPRRQPKAFYYTVYAPLIERFDDLNVDSAVGGRPGEEELLKRNLEFFYWLSVPGLRVDKHSDTVRNPCFTSKEYREQIGKFFAAASDWLPFQKAIGGVVVDEWEYAHWRAAENPHDLCHSPTCLAAFREFLKQDYRGSLEDLNKTWDSAWTSWDQVEMKLVKDVDVRKNAAPLVDRLRFNEQVVADVLGFINDEARKHDPDLRLGLSGTRPASAYNGYDYCKLWQGRMCAIADYSGPMPLQSFSLAKPGDYVTTWQGYGTNNRPTAGDAMWRSFMDGQGGLLNYCAWPHFGAQRVDWTLMAGARAWTQVFRELDSGLAELVRGGQRENDGVAIHYSQASVHTVGLGLIEGLDMRQFYANMNGLIQLLRDAGLDPRFVSYAQIERGELAKAGCRALWMPLSVALSDAEAAQLRAFVESGGMVVADGLCGLYDHHGRKRPRGVLDDLFGVAREGVRFVDEVGQLAVDAAFTHGGLGGRTMNSVSAELGARPDGGRAFAALSVAGKQVPALIVNETGKGRAVFANVVVSDYSIVRAAGVGGEVAQITRAKAGRRSEAQTLMRGVLELAGVRPAVAVTNSAPPDEARMETRIVRYRDGQASYVMVHPNATGTWELDKRLRNPARIRLPQQGHVYDVRGGKYLGAVQEVDRTLTEGEPDIFGVMPYRVTGVTCAVDRPSFTVGDAVTCGVKVAASAPAGRHVVLVRVSGPDGKERPAYTAKVEAPQGVGSARFVLALNDPAGTWKVVARDTVSGLEATADFTVAQRLAAP